MEKMIWKWKKTSKVFAQFFFCSLAPKFGLFLDSFFFWHKKWTDFRLLSLDNLFLSKQTKMRSVDESITHTLMRYWAVEITLFLKLCIIHIEEEKTNGTITKLKSHKKNVSIFFYDVEELMNTTRTTWIWTRQNGKQILWNWAIFTSYVQLLYTISIYTLNKWKTRSVFFWEKKKKFWDFFKKICCYYW